MATAASSSCFDFVKFTSTLSSGPKTTTATGRFGLRVLMKFRAACIAPAIGAPCMLFDASMSRIAPLAVPGASTVRFVTVPPFSETTLPSVSARRSGRRRSSILSGKLESRASESVGDADWADRTHGRDERDEDRRDDRDGRGDDEGQP